MRSMKDDIKQFRDACLHLGMTAAERNDFGDYIHDLKASGDGGSANGRGDFTWDELLERGREYLERVRK